MSHASRPNTVFYDSFVDSRLNPLGPRVDGAPLQTNEEKMGRASLPSGGGLPSPRIRASEE